MRSEADAVGRITDMMQTAHDEIPWATMRGMRDRLIG